MHNLRKREPLVRKNRHFTMDAGVAFLYRMPAGIPGEVMRAESAIVETQIITPYGTTGAPGSLGIAGVIDASTGWFRAPTSTADTVMYGMLVREYPIQAGTQTPVLGVGAPPPLQGPCSVLKKGYMTVFLQGSTSAYKDGPAYVRVAGTIPSGGFLGGIEAAADGTAANTPLLSNTYFMGPQDANGFVELAYHMQ